MCLFAKLVMCTLKNRKPENIMDFENHFDDERKPKLILGGWEELECHQNIVTTIPDHEDLFL